MISQQILINSLHTNTISNDTKNPMTESKKFYMKGLTVLENKSPRMIRKVDNPMIGPKKSSMKGFQNPRKNVSKRKNPQDGLSKHDLKILDRYYTPKKGDVMSFDITTKSKYGVSPSLVCCKFLIKLNFLFFLFTHNKNLEK